MYASCLQTQLWTKLYTALDTLCSYISSERILLAISELWICAGTLSEVSQSFLFQPHCKMCSRKFRRGQERHCLMCCNADCHSIWRPPFHSVVFFFVQNLFFKPPFKCQHLRQWWLSLALMRWGKQEGVKVTLALLSLMLSFIVGYRGSKERVLMKFVIKCLNSVVIMSREESTWSKLVLNFSRVREAKFKNSSSINILIYQISPKLSLKHGTFLQRAWSSYSLQRNIDMYQNIILLVQWHFSSILNEHMHTIFCKLDVAWLWRNFQSREICQRLRVGKT